MIFTVYDKKTSQQVEVFDVQRDKCGYPQFLIRVGNQWLYRSAKYYTTKNVNKKGCSNCYCDITNSNICCSYCDKKDYCSKECNDKPSTCGDLCDLVIGEQN